MLGFLDKLKLFSRFKVICYLVLNVSATSVPYLLSRDEIIILCLYINFGVLLS